MRSVSNTTRSCNTLLCLRLCNNAKGMAFIARDIYTAVPVTRTGGDFSNEAIIASNELPCSYIRRSKLKRSLFQVVMMINITSPSDSGNQPPENSFRALAENIGISIINKTTSKQPTKTRFQCQFFSATVQNRILVITMVPVTAIP
ncbi:Uncharacterised protein [Yersinia pekkanenii]|uniref:Uncharacterized protein n=1 Tax=Yersinia pekkanenii TaxID=1288385 RepID=A0A0T9PFN1_9GAMM|nr:Uncharacterised protein [Yersinia pekkanenii]